MLYGKQLKKFIDWLNERGAEMLKPTNEYEVIRFKGNGNVGVVYKNKIDRITAITGEAQKAYQCFLTNSSYSCNEVKKRIRKHIVFETLLQRDGTNCFYCGKEMPDGEETIEHIFSINNGGTNHINNLALTHQSCNFLVANKSIVEKIRIRDEMRCINSVDA